MEDGPVTYTYKDPVTVDSTYLEDQVKNAFNNAKSGDEVGICGSSYTYHDVMVAADGNSNTSRIGTAAGNVNDADGNALDLDTHSTGDTITLTKAYIIKQKQMIMIKQ